MRRKKFNLKLAHHAYLAAKKANLESEHLEPFKVYAKSEADTLQIYVHGVVGDQYDELDSGTLAPMIRKHAGPISLDINTMGGSAFDAMSIFNALVDHKFPTSADITGAAMSAGTIISAGVDQVSIRQNATYMIHRAWGIMMGNALVAEDVAKELRAIDNQIADILAERSGKTTEEVLELMDGSVDGTTFTGQEAVDEGFADVLVKNRRKKSNTARAARKKRPQQHAAYRKPYCDRKALLAELTR